MLIVGGLLGCAQDRDRGSAPEPCPTWNEEIAELLRERCVDCHGAESPAGDYDLSSYLGALGSGGGGGPNAVAGEQSSRILQQLAPRTADALHAPLAEDVLPVLERWVVQCDLAYEDSRIHEPGILNPSDPDFHGTLLRDSGWDFDRCARCHGEDFEGGRAKSSCTSCHQDGPTSCNTCHRDPLRSRGAHDAHLTSSVDGLPFDECAQCHRTPSDYRDEGHLFSADGGVDAHPAEVRLGALARHDPAGEREHEPQYDPSNGTCRGVYCHGGSFDDAEAGNTTPRWYLPDAGQARCGSCHGIPPASHAQDRCASCHQQVAGAGPTVTHPGLHVDGEVQVGRADGERCTGCHGSARGAAPPSDLQGRDDPSLVTVGAHRSHLLAPRRLSAPIACTECHRVPETVDAPGHIDTPPPAEAFDGMLEGRVAAADGARPRFDRDSATCSGVYCHGGGDGLGADRTPGLNQEPTWTAVGEGEAACGSCHGIPPRDGAHDAELDLRSCHECHGSVDEFGNILVRDTPDGLQSDHIDGELDVR